MTQIIPTAEPFFFPGKGANAKISCLVIHGFTGAKIQAGEWWVIWIRS